MSYWQNLRKEVMNKTTSSDITTMVYKKIASSGVNMLGIIKPSFYIGQMVMLSHDYMGYVDKFLLTEEGDWGEYLKFILYIREMSKRLLVNVQNLSAPLGDLIRAMEEIFEGEEYGDELEEEPEPEEIEEPEELDKILEGKDDDEEEEEEEELGEKEEISEVTREDLTQEYENLKEDLRVKIRQAEVPDRVVKELSREIADVYLECVQLCREVERLSHCPEGDIPTLMSILVDIQYGLCYEMKRHLLEDIMVKERFQFDPGLLTWTAHFLANFSEKINKEWKVEEE